MTYLQLAMMGEKYGGYTELYIARMHCPTALCVTGPEAGDEKCMKCWNREIPEKDLENMKERFKVKEDVNVIMTDPNVDVKPEPTIEELEKAMAEGEATANHLKKLIKQRKEQEKYDEAAQQMAMIRDSYIRAGFTREEATTMTIEMIRLSIVG